METQPSSNPNSRREKHRRALASVARWGIPNESACHEPSIQQRQSSDMHGEGPFYEVVINPETGDISARSNQEL